MKWDKENPYLFLEDWRRNDAKMNAFWSETRSVWEREMGKTVNSHENSRETLKNKFFFKKLSLKCKTRVFCDWYNRQFHPPKHFKPKVLKKFAKCFSRLEVSLARESWVELRKSLCTPRDWTFHSRTSCQNRPGSSRQWHVTWMTRDWVAKTGQHYFWNFQFL